MHLYVVYPNINNRRINEPTDYSTLKIDLNLINY